MGSEMCIRDRNVVATKSTLPVLSNLLIDTDKEKIRMIATDLEVGMRCTIKAEVIKPGGITLPARKLSEVIREAPHSEIQLTEEGSRVTLKSGNYTAKLIGIPKDEYPALPEFKESSSFSIETGLMAEMIRKTIFSVSTDETRYVLCGIYFICEKKRLKMVSTDGRRLSYIEKGIEGGKIRERKVIIPTKAINEVNKILTQSSGTLKVGIGDNQIGFKINDSILLISRLIEGNYPNYEQVIPKNSEISLLINREKLLNSTKRVAVLTSDKSSSIRYTLKGNSMIITATTQGLGEARDELPIEYDKEELTIAYNPNYIMDVLKNLESENIIIELTNPLNPGIIKPDDNSNYLSVIMPMRI